ncbi:MAG: 3'-5' exonuclease [Deltaproteobacteria bacterium]|nr:MAG: 3'-5' exonuclease [Deltaproteobacteria bacterium]
MFKAMHNKIWVFDVEWIPDPAAGRLLYQLPESSSDQEVIQEMWKEGGATEEEPMPYLKTVLCRVVSISAVIRTAGKGEIKLQLLSLPRDPQDPTQASEDHIIGTFLDAVGTHQPQLVGFNSRSADLKILVQRGLANGIQAEGFCTRPGKPWEGVDYFARTSDWHIDLLDILGGWGKSTPSLHEMATVCRIPGKLSADGQQVAPLWLNGELARIVAYNEFDALTTYLLWLRLTHFGGFLTTAEYEGEQELLRELLTIESQKPDRRHLKDYLEEWDALRGVN